MRLIRAEAALNSWKYFDMENMNVQNLHNLSFMFSGKQFQTYNVHQLLHLTEVVDDVGPLWSNSCFPFEDYNGDLRDLFHGTQNVDGQVCIISY